MLPRILSLLVMTVVGCKPPPNSGGAVSSPSSAATAAGDATSLVGPGNVIPLGRLAVDVMEFGTPPRVAELSRRQFQARLKDKNQPWWQERDEKIKAGQSVPYDARTGLTPAEYDELENLKKQKIRQKGAATISITKAGTEVYVVDGGPALPELTGIVIDLKNDQVRTPFGVTARHGSYKMPETSPTGAHSGIRWKHETPDASDKAGTYVALSIGRMEPSGRGILVYYVRKLTPPEQKQRQNVMLYYDLPAAP